MPRRVPGERLQVDTIKIANGNYPYTAIDDGTRYQVARLYPHRTAANKLKFLPHVVEEMPFPIQRIQTDRGREFTAYDVRETLAQWGINWHPKRARSPHLNGKVERGQKATLQESYAVADLTQSLEELNAPLGEYQDDYNRERVHGSFQSFHTPSSSSYDITGIEQLCGKTSSCDDQCE